MSQQEENADRVTKLEAENRRLKRKLESADPSDWNDFMREFFRLQGADIIELKAEIARLRESRWAAFSDEELKHIGLGGQVAMNGGIGPCPVCAKLKQEYSAELEARTRTTISKPSQEPCAT
jgi:hypothetical protein